MSKNIERKLAAIMFTDIAGYTEQMSKDEDKAFALIKKKRGILLPLVEKYEGKLIKEIGDGTLTRYFKADNAIDCASIFQSNTDTELNVRAGIHTGEVIVDNEDVFGDVVNVASRLESIAVPGSILVSKETIDKLEMTDKVKVVPLGMQSLKGVGRLIDVYAIKDDNLVIPNPDDYLKNRIDIHSDDEVPSIAIIPFKNKGLKEDNFYTYGISVDLITDVASAGLIRVASISDIEKLDYTNLDNTELSDKLFVRYISQGALWKRDNMFQLSVELYDTKNKKVIWSDRWQENWNNLPIIKGSLSDGLLKLLDTKSKVEKKIETSNPEAYKFYLKAKHKYTKRKNTNDTDIARELLHKAIDLDDNLIIAKNLLGTTYREIGEYDKAINIYNSTLKQADKYGDKHGVVFSLNSIANVYTDQSNDEKALVYYEKALKISEDIGDNFGKVKCLGNIGILYARKADHDKALEYYEKSNKIREMIGDESGMGTNFHNIGIVYCSKGDFEKSLIYFHKSVKIKEKLGDKYGMALSFNSIGIVYNDIGEVEKALNYHNKGLKIREDIGDKHGAGYSLMSLGNIYFYQGNNKKALDYLKQALEIKDKMNDKYGMGYCLVNIGIVYSNNGDDKKALRYLERSLKLQDRIGNKEGIAHSLINIGKVYSSIGDDKKALNYLEKSLKIREEIGNKDGIAASLLIIGIIYWDKGDFKNALHCLEKSLSIQKEIKLNVGTLLIETTTYLYLIYKHIGREYDVNKIHTIINESSHIDFEQNLRLYQLLEDSSYLKTAYNQIFEKADAMQKKLKEKFLTYPIPKEILEEYNKVFK